MAKHLFVHIGDTHIGPGPRLADKLSALDQIIVWVDRLAAEGRLAAILWPGDLFHAKSTIEDRNALAPRLQRLAQRAPVVLVDGNHDAPGDLEILSRLQAFYPVHVVSHPKTLHIEGPTGELAIACLPYPHRAGLVSAGITHDDLGQVARQLLDPVFMQFAQELADADSEGQVPLFVGHVNVGGSIASTGQPQIGRELELDPALLERLGPVYKGLNHIHKHQVIYGAVYAGSICRQDFGENEPKGFVLAQFDDETREWSWEFVSLDVPAQYLVEGRLTRECFILSTVDGDAVCDAPSWTGADVKVRYHYKRSETGALDVAAIMAEFAGCRSLKLDAIAELEHSVRAPEVAAAVTVNAKVEAYFHRREIPFTPRVAAKLDALQQQTAEQVLAQVASTPTQAQRSAA